MVRPHIVVISLAVIGLAMGVAACSSDGIESAGILESPCSSNADCVTGLCLQLAEYSMCTRRCEDHWSGSCPDGYVCAGSPAVCTPDPTSTTCRSTEQTCGSQFAQCCPGLACVAWTDVPWHCARPCAHDGECESGCCVASAESGVGVCGPPSFCE